VHRDHAIEIRATQLAVRPGAFERREQLVLEPSLLARRDAGGHDLLRKDVQRSRGLRRAIEIAALHGTQHRRRLHQLVDRQRKSRPFGTRPIA
jgi:hypothetical protein